MQHQFRKVMAARENVPLAEDEPVPICSDLTLPGDLSMESLEEIPPQFLGETKVPVDPDSLTFAVPLFTESQVSFDHPLGRNLIDVILDYI
jgi:hypothetical protein